MSPSSSSLLSQADSRPPPTTTTSDPGPSTSMTRSESVASSMASRSGESFWASNRSSIGSYLTMATSHAGDDGEADSKSTTSGQETRVDGGETPVQGFSALFAALETPSLAAERDQRASSSFLRPLVFQPRAQRRSINRSLAVAGLDTSPSTPVFPLRARASAPSLRVPHLAHFGTSPSPLSAPVEQRASNSTSALPLITTSFATLHPPSSALPSPSSLSLTPSEQSERQAYSPSSSSPSAAGPPFPSSPSPPLAPPSSSAYKQSPRWPSDEYTPLWVRGKGKDKVGWCGKCPPPIVVDGAGGEEAGEEGERKEETKGKRWFNLKDASYWFHTTFSHGISSKSGRPFDPPLQVRHVPPPASNDASTSVQLEGLCGTCKEWKPFETVRPSSDMPSRTPWYAHAHECHEQLSPAGKATSSASSSSRSASSGGGAGEGARRSATEG
ncbi:hypothetical protein JCM8547_005184 [Rhodosporidiobolus lusitaniae]